MPYLMEHQAIVERLPDGWRCRGCGRLATDGAVPYYRNNNGKLAGAKCRDCERADKRARAIVQRDADLKAKTAPTVIDAWRCAGCRKGRKHGVEPLLGGTGIPNIRCAACREDQRRRLKARQNAKRESKDRNGAGARFTTSKFTVAELRAKYLGNAAKDEADAAIRDSRGDHAVAERLRDRANDWRALAKRPYAH